MQKTAVGKIKDIAFSFLVPSVYALELLLRLKFRGTYFYFKDSRLSYFFHSYNNFGRKVRCIEIPIIRYYLDCFPHERVLEIGNVTKHYYEWLF